MAEKDTSDIRAEKLDHFPCRKCKTVIDASESAFFSIIECPECHTRQTIPAQFGGFLLLDKLGKGGMGIVYQALDTALNRNVAIKVMKSMVADDVESFLQEARAAAAINHRNVVQIYSCAQHDGQPYIVMELVSGGRMDKMVNSGKPMDEIRVLEIGIDVAEGLNAAQEKQLIHGDIKPENILFNQKGLAKVVDFGLARFINRKAAPGEIWGTPYYIAPEKARRQAEDHRSDIYSLGATLYHALTGHPPFDGKTATDVVIARLKTPPKDLRTILPGLHPETANLVMRMLEPDPFKRYPTYTSLLADMREALETAKADQKKPQKKKKTHTHLTPIIITVALIVVLVIVGIWMVIRKQPWKTTMNVPVAATAPAASLEPLPTESPAPSESEIIETVEPFQPFNETQQTGIVEAMGLVAANKTVEADEKMRSVSQSLNQESIGQYWIQLLQVIIDWQSGDDENEDHAIHVLYDADFSSKQEQSGVLVQQLAGYLSGSVSLDALNKEVAEWPSWYADICLFYEGLHGMMNEDISAAEVALQSYMETTGDDPQWPYAMKPVAAIWLEHIGAWQALTSQVDAFSADNMYDDALAALKRFDVSVIPFLSSNVQVFIDRTELAQKEYQERKKAEQQQAYIEAVQYDLDQLDAARGDNIPFVAKKDFKRCAANLSSLLPLLETTEGRKALQLLKDAYQKMDGLKKALSGYIDAAPFPSTVAPELGQATGANRDGVRVVLGSHGSVLVSWADIDVRTWVRLSNYYIARDKRSSRQQRAELYLALSLYCYENLGFKPAEEYAKKAIVLNPELKTSIRQMMPGLL